MAAVAGKQAGDSAFESQVAMAEIEGRLGLWFGGMANSFADGIKDQG